MQGRNTLLYTKKTNPSHKCKRWHNYINKNQKKKKTHQHAKHGGGGVMWLLLSWVVFPNSCCAPHFHPTSSCSWWWFWGKSSLSPPLPLPFCLPTALLFPSCCPQFPPQGQLPFIVISCKYHPASISLQGWGEVLGCFLLGVPGVSVIWHCHPPLIVILSLSFTITSCS
jgi:hypothetical protein